MMQTARHNAVLFRHVLDQIDALDMEVADLRWKYELARKGSDTIYERGPGGEVREMTPEALRAVLQRAEERRRVAEDILMYLTDSTDLSVAMERVDDLLSAYRRCLEVRDYTRRFEEGADVGEIFPQLAHEFETTTEVERFLGDLTHRAHSRLDKVTQTISVPPVTNLVA